MTKPKSINEFLRNIRPYQKGIHLIELFGSYARGDYHPGSDIDLLVVVKNNKMRDKLFEAVDSSMGAVGYNELLSPLIMDLPHYQKIKKLNTDFYYYLSKEGKVLWEE